jgi:hypothetical protein
MGPKMHFDERREADHARVEMDNHALGKRVAGRIGTDEALFDLSHSGKHLEDAFRAPMASPAEANLLHRVHPLPARGQVHRDKRTAMPVRRAVSRATVRRQ